MPPKNEEKKKRTRKRKQRENVTDQPDSHIITYVSDIPASTSSSYPPQQGGIQSSGHSVAPASTATSFPLVIPSSTQSLPVRNRTAAQISTQNLQRQDRRSSEQFSNVEQHHASIPIGPEVSTSFSPRLQVRLFWFEVFFNHIISHHYTITLFRIIIVFIWNSLCWQHTFGMFRHRPQSQFLREATSRAGHLYCTLHRYNYSEYFFYHI